MREAHLSLDVRAAAYEGIDDNTLGAATVLSIAVVFRRHPRDHVHVVETHELLVPADDLLADKARTVQRSADHIAALRHAACTAVLTCPGVCLIEEDGDTFPVCGALTPDFVKGFLEAQDL